MRTEIRKEVDHIFRKENFIRGEYCTNPITGTAFMWIGVGEDSMAFQKRVACRALVAQRWSEDVNPNCPKLPVNYYDILDYKHGSGVMRLFAYYARSIYARMYRVARHPSFEVFARGVLAHREARAVFGNNPSIAQLFPPQFLPGLGAAFYYEPPR